MSRSKNHRSPKPPAHAAAPAWATGDQLSRRTSSRTGKTASTISACPSSIPTLNVARAARSMSPDQLSEPANPSPCSRPKPKTIRQPVAALAAEHHVGRHVGDRERDQRLDDLRRHVHPAERAERQRDAVRGGERGRQLDHLAEAAGAEQQRQQEQHVVDPEQDVLDPDRHEAAGRGGERRLAGLELAVPGVEHEGPGGAGQVVVARRWCGRRPHRRRRTRRSGSRRRRRASPGTRSRAGCACGRARRARRRRRARPLPSHSTPSRKTWTSGSTYASGVPSPAAASSTAVSRLSS